MRKANLVSIKKDGCITTIAANGYSECSTVVVKQSTTPEYFLCVLVFLEKQKMIENADKNANRSLTHTNALVRRLCFQWVNHRISNLLYRHTHSSGLAATVGLLKKPATEQ
jgi:hypothetical protein